MSNPKANDNREAQLLKDCRVWQLKPDVDIHMKFISYEELTKQFGEPEQAHYQPVFEGRVETNDLEALCKIFNTFGRPVKGGILYP